jgi:hypothetical protein
MKFRKNKMNVQKHVFSLSLSLFLKIDHLFRGYFWMKVY